MTKRADLLEPSELSEIPKPIESPQKEWQVANSFSKYVAGEMEKGCRNGSFDSVIFCAEPVLLDILFRSIGICTNSAIIGKVPLDLYEVNESDLVNYIKDIIGQAGTSEAA
ncbi:MAG: hypothetical protein A3K03_02345 [Bdellovibrionales bacterium RIFOXYD1_FULL_44_7]|nr:MAG: hypothetical protein A3K03_02345 [Bdellovibrionales bacterium RIFOXYD1_FULL_44_7]